MIIASREEENTKLLSLTNAVGLSLTLSSFGAGIYEIRYDGQPMTIAEKDVALYLRSGGYFGKTVGRLAGRVKNGILLYRGKTYQLGINDGKNSLHGGPGGLSFQLFKEAVMEEKGSTSVIYSYLSEDGEMGYPGAVDFAVRYRIYESEPRIDITLSALSDRDTPINMTTHTYFNLGGSPTILGESLQIKATGEARYDGEMVPIGKEALRNCTDFRVPKLIGKDIKDPSIYEPATHGYDHGYYLGKHPYEEPVCTMKGNGFRLDLLTDAPCLQAYSDNFPRLGVMLSNGNKEQENSAIAIEPVGIPGDIESMSALAGKKKEVHISYVFSKEETK